MITQWYGWVPYYYRLNIITKAGKILDMQLLSNKMALLRMLGWRILQGFQSLFHFLKKRCFHRLLREYPTDSLL